MAVRKRRSQLTTKESDNNGQPDQDLTTNELLRYLVKPLHLPLFDFSAVTSEHFLVRTIRKLLIEAITDRILPRKVVGVQFIFAKRTGQIKKKGGEEVEGNFSFPLLLCCENADKARGISEGMSYVTDLLMKQPSSFHLRIRKFNLVHSPAVCVFSSLEREEPAQFDSTNVLWVNLPIDETVKDRVSLSSQYVDDRGKDFDGRHFYETNLHAAIANGCCENIKPAAVTVTTPVRRVKIVGQSHFSADSLRKARLEEMREDLAADRDYLERVSYLLAFGDVILCTPHAYDIRPTAAENKQHPHEVITDAGLTVITDRSKGRITEDDWLRVQAVAQKLAIFAGAAVSTAASAREGILDILNDSFAHEFSNASREIVGSLTALMRKAAVLSTADVSDIEGRLQFAQTFIDAPMLFYKATESVSLAKILKALIGPMRKYKNLQIDDLDISLYTKYQVTSLWQVAIGEALRNAYKHCLPGSDGKKHISVNVSVAMNQVTLLITNNATREFILDSDREGWALMQRIASICNGKILPIDHQDLFSVNIRMPLIAV